MSIPLAADMPHSPLCVEPSLPPSVPYLLGVRRIASLTEKLVPFMAFFYLLGGFAVLAINRSEILPAFRSIFVGAFNPQAVVGGAVGIGVRQAMRYGVARGLFSNEAGMGSTPHAHALAKVDRPQDQGIMAIVSVFIDTFVVLNMTALVILTSGQLQPGVEGSPQGTALTQAAFGKAFGSFGNAFVAVACFSCLPHHYRVSTSQCKALFGREAPKSTDCGAVYHPRLLPQGAAG